MRLIRCFSFGKVSNSRVINRLKLAVAEMLRPFCCHASERSAFYIPKTCVILPSLTVKFIKTPLKALFYLGFSAVPFRFTI